MELTKLADRAGIVEENRTEIQAVRNALSHFVQSSGAHGLCGYNKSDEFDKSLSIGKRTS